jgi:hypothetical protein
VMITRTTLWRQLVRRTQGRRTQSSSSQVSHQQTGVP